MPSEYKLDSEHESIWKTFYFSGSYQPISGPRDVKIKYKFMESLDTQ